MRWPPCGRRCSYGDPGEVLGEMSIQAMAWAMEQTAGGTIGKALLLVLANYADEAGSCFPGQQRLAEQLECTERSVREWLVKLERLGLIRREERRRPGGYRTSDRIFLSLGGLPEPASGENPSAEPGSDLTGRRFRPRIYQENRQSFSPQPPLAGGLEFAALWEAWPIGHRGHRENAEGTFSRLDAEERASATRAARFTLKVLGLRKARVPALVSYLRGKLFVEFDGAPPVDFDGHFVIRPGMAEWGPWLGDVRNTFGEEGVQRAIRPGFMARKTRWPPGHELHMPPLRAHPPGARHPATGASQ